MVKVFNSNIFNAKIINNQAKLDGMPFVAPKSWHGGSFKTAFSNKVGSKMIVGKDAGLRKTISALENFKVYPTITVLIQEVVFQDELVWDIRNLDTYIFRIGHGCV